MNWNTFIQPLGWTLLHFLWQGAVIAAVTVLTRYVLRGRSAQARYVAGCLALAAMAIAPSITFYLQMQDPVVAVSTLHSVTLVDLSNTPSESPMASAIDKPSQPNASEFVASTKNSSPKYGQKLERVFPWLVGIWLIGVSFFTLRLLGGWLRLQRLRSAGVKDVEAALRECLGRLSARLGLRRKIKLVQSALVQVPTVIGWFKPVILLPLSTLSGLTQSQLEAILVHELAHIRRHDFLINLLQSLLETVLFYHPAVWWISRQVREEREHCCDDLAVEVCGDKMNYARALAALEELRLSPAQLALAADGGSLISRIRRMLLPATEATPRGPAWLSGLVVCGFMLLVAVSNLVSAQNGDVRPEKTGEQTVLQAAKDVALGQAPLRKTRAAWLLQFRLVAKERILHVTEEFLDPNGKGKLHVQKEVLLDESHVLSAEATTSPLDPTRNEIDIQLNPAGTRIFAKLTKENIGKQLAVVYGGQLLTAPTIQSEITAGRLQITGNYTAGEAVLLAATINMAAKDGEQSVVPSEISTQKEPGKRFREVDANAVVDGERMEFPYEGDMTLLRQMLNLVQSASVNTTDPSLEKEWNELLNSSNRLHLKIDGGISQVLPVDERNTHRLMDISEILMKFPGVYPRYIYVKEGPRIFAFSKYNPLILKEVGWPNVIKLEDNGEGGSVGPLLTIHKGPLAWQSKNPYDPPTFEGFFPDDPEGGAKLDALWRANDKDGRSDTEILATVRTGLRRTKEHRTSILRWIGNRYIWGKTPQNEEAIEIMYHAADVSGPNADPFGTRHYAVYFGLSVVSVKTPAILRTLADLSMQVDDPNDLDRIAWGCSSQRTDLLKYLEPHLQSADPAVKAKAQVLERIFKGELKAFEWAKERARQRAEANYKSELPRIRTVLSKGDSTERATALELIMRNRLALIMDDSFIDAFAKCGEDSSPENRDKVAIIAGDKWIWSAKEQHPDAIALMLKLSRDVDREVRYNAVYYGLSTVRRKDDVLIDRMLEMAADESGSDLKQRIFWGLRSDKDKVLRILDSHINGSDERRATLARALKEEFSGGSKRP